MAEIELSVLRRDLPERVADKTTLEHHAAAWQHRRNAPRPSEQTGASPPPTLASSYASFTRR